MFAKSTKLSQNVQRAFIVLGAVFIASSFWTETAAQTKALDYLKDELRKEANPYRRIDLHLGVCRAATFYGDTEQCKRHLDTALLLSRREKYSYGELRTMLMQVTFMEEDHNAAYADVLDQATRLAAQEGDPRLQRMVDFTHLSDLLESGDLHESEVQLAKLLSKYSQGTYGQKASAFFYQAELHYLKGEYRQAIEAYNKALPLYDNHSESPPIVPELERASSLNTVLPYMNQGKLHVEIGRLQTDLGEYEAALRSFTSAEEIFSDAEADSFLGWTLMDKGSLFAAQGDLARAVEIGQQAIRIFERLGLASDLADAYFEISSLYLDQLDLDAAEQFLQKSLEIISGRTNYSLEYDIYQSFARISSLRQNSKLASSYLEKAVRVAERSEDILLLAPALLNLGQSLYLEEDFLSAIDFTQRSRALAKQLNAQEDLFLANNLLVESYLALGKIDSAQNYQSQNLAFIGNGISLRQQQELVLQESKLAEIKGDYQSALASWKKYHEYDRQIFSGAAQGKLKEEQVRQNVRDINRSKELAEQEAQLLSRQNQLYLLIAFVLLGVLLFAAYAYQKIRKVKLELESKNLQLAQLNETKDKFFGIIAHDIRSPIVALDGVGEQMRYFLDKGRADKLERLANRVNGTAKRLSSLLDNLLKWALLQQGVIPYNPKAIYLAESGMKVLDMYRENADVKNITLSLEVAKGQMVYADEAALQTILRNLVSNAIKFTPNGGRVSIGAEMKEDKVFIKVNDTGTGISAEKLERLFTLDKVSETGTAGEKGTGLGLTLVKELAELNRGSLAVHSEPTVGTVISIGLPAAA